MMKSRLLRTSAVAALVVVAGGLTASQTLLAEEGTEISALFPATVGLYPGNDVQILGVPVGHVTEVEPDGGQVRVVMELEPGQKVDPDTAAVIVAPTVVSDRFVQLTEPWTGGPSIKDGTEISADRTAVPVEIDDLYRSMIDVSEKLGPRGANANGALSRLLSVAADNLDGQGAGLNQMLREFGKASSTLSGIDDDFFATLANLEEFNSMLKANDGDVAAMNRRFATVTEYLAADRDELAEATANLADAFVVLDDFIAENRDHLRTSVKKLNGPTKVLTRQRESLEESVRLIPLLLQNFIQAYNPKTNTVDGRGNLNEITLWSKDGLTARTSPDAPPVMLDGEGSDEARADPRRRHRAEPGPLRLRAVGRRCL
ncbi:MCE family protein [Nocardioides alcanivorans]|uniref:MCE family protein n=1 Tax=Nocardioides alcanivorans TaxID=2897352 RepID=UPI001F297E5D|nr:MCE family protein [Nocardioides alcanivorans]